MTAVAYEQYHCHWTIHDYDHCAYAHSDCVVFGFVTRAVAAADAAAGDDDDFGHHQIHGCNGARAAGLAQRNCCHQYTDYLSINY